MQVKILEYYSESANMNDVEDSLNTFLKEHEVKHVNTFVIGERLVIVLFYEKK